MVQFDLVEVALWDTDEGSVASQLMPTPVVSVQMAKKLTGVGIPQLQFGWPTDSEGHGILSAGLTARGMTEVDR